MNKYIDLAKQFGLKEEDVLTQIRNEHSLGNDYIQVKRKLREEDLKTLYVPTSKQDKVNINSIYTTMQTLMSVYYTDKMEVNFQPRKVSGTEIAANLTRLAEFDYDEMGLDNLDYQWNWDRFFFGVGIKIIDGWNKITQTPIARVISPLSWIPDPRGGLTIDTHRFAGFEVEDSLYSMKSKTIYSNLDLINSADEGRQEEIRLAYLSGRSLVDQGIEQIENKKYPIYHHYTIINGKKYLVTTANSNRLIIRMVELIASTDEERKYPHTILFPIALKYYSPVKGDAYGISVPDLLRDKQKAESKLFNLAIAKETRNTLGEDIFYNPLKIKNSKILTTPSINPKAIPVSVKANESIANVVYRMPKESQANSAFNTNAQIQFQNSLSTGIDANSLGITGGGNQTATEAQITQKNANLRFILGTKIGKLGEDIFWKLYLKSYAINLKPSSKKVLYVTKAFGTQYYEFKRKDLITKELIDIKIISVSEKQSLQQSQKADFYAIAPQLLADPELPSVSKNYIKRKMLRLSGLSEEEINIMQPKTIDEMNAQLGVNLINLNKKPPSPKKGEDHLTYIYAYLAANDNIIKYEAIEEREQAYIEEGGSQSQIEKANALGGDNTMGNIAASNAAQQSSANLQGSMLNARGNVNAAGI